MYEAAFSHQWENALPSPTLLVTVFRAPSVPVPMREEGRGKKQKQDSTPNQDFFFHWFLKQLTWMCFQGFLWPRSFVLFQSKQPWGGLFHPVVCPFPWNGSKLISSHILRQFTVQNMHTLEHTLPPISLLQSSSCFNFHSPVSCFAAFIPSFCKNLSCVNIQSVTVSSLSKYNNTFCRLLNLTVGTGWIYCSKRATSRNIMIGKNGCLGAGWKEQTVLAFGVHVHLLSWRLTVWEKAQR